MPDPFEITSTEIAVLSQAKLPEVVNRLLRAEARNLGIPVGDVSTSPRYTDPDGGIDAHVRAGIFSSAWLPPGDSVWQYKAGSAPDKAIIENETRKADVTEAIKNGATYVLVMGAAPTHRVCANRRKLLREAIDAIKPGASHRLLTGSDIAQWANEHPVMRFAFGRPVANYWPLDHWRWQQPPHQIPFEPDEERATYIQTIRRALAAPDGPVHIRLEGPPGVGKTRLAIEAFSDYPDTVLYTMGPPGDEVFFSWMAASPNAEAILVVDECDVARAGRLEQLANMSGGRLRLLTIGHEEFRGASTRLFKLTPLDEDTMRRVVHAAASTLSHEQVRWVARVARGYVKLATVLAVQVAQAQAATATNLASIHDVQAILGQLLPDQRTRQAMQGLALLRRVGWDREVAGEGQAIAQFIGMPWNEMRQLIGRMVLQGLVAVQGRYRYVTPEMLALWLAGDLWQIRGSDLLDLLNHLPTPQGREALLSRMAGLGGVPEISTVVRDLLGPAGPFDHIDNLDSERSAKLFSLLVKAYPDAALDALERILTPATPERLLRFTTGRREVVWVLHRLTRWRRYFFRAARLLLQLAEAENETWSNNATGVWASLFLTRVAGTEVPALERYQPVQEALLSESPRRRELALLALERAFQNQEMGLGTASESDGNVPPTPWRPQTWDEVYACRRAALHLLDRALQDPDQSVHDQALRTLLRSARDLVHVRLADDLLSRFERLDVPNEAQRREVWETIQNILTYDREVLTNEQRARFEARAGDLFGRSFRDRLRRYTGRLATTDWPDPDHPAKPKPGVVAATLAEEAIRSPEALRSELGWLTSEEAENVWAFGRRLGELDETHSWLDDLIAAAQAGRNPRLLSAYLRGRADVGKGDWREQLLDDWTDDEARVALVVDATWQGEATSRAVARLVRLVDCGWLSPGTLGLLVYDGWVRALSAEDLHALLERVVSDESTQASEAGLAMLTMWMTDHGNELAAPLLPIAWRLIERPPSWEGRPMLSFYWSKVGSVLLRHEVVRVARAIVQAVSTASMSSRDRRLELLQQALAREPEVVCDEISAMLLRDDPIAVHLEITLQFWIDEADPLGDTDAARLLAWARADLDTRPQILAQLIKPKVMITPVMRGLLAEYGPESRPARTLAGNFFTGTWWGSETEHLEQQREQVVDWLQDPEPAVRTWAKHVLDAIDERLPGVRLREEEEHW